MKNNVKKKLIYGINICLMISLILISISTAQATVSANRAIDSTELVAGNSTNVTVVINNDATEKPLSLQETIPSGWDVKSISGDGGQFDASTNEWTWLSVASDATKTVKYMITVPSDTVSGTYNINGNVTANESNITVDGDNTIDVTGGSAEPVNEPFGFVVDPSSATVSTGEDAKYNLTISNTGSVVDTYTFNVTKPTNVNVSLTRISTTVVPGNSSIVGLRINSSTKGIYVVNVTATSKADTSNNATITTTTNVTVPVLDITDFKSVPNSAISDINPAQISANVIKGINKIALVAFYLVDSNNLLGSGTDKIISADANVSGVQGLYNAEPWPASYMTMGNVAVSDFVTVYKDNSNTGNLQVMGTFKANKNSNDTEAIMSFNRTTGKLSNVTNKNPSGTKLTIQNASSTFRAKIGNASGPSEYASTNAFTLYSVTGNIAVNNPQLLANTVPDGEYGVYALVNDTKQTVVKFIDIDTIPSSPSGGGSSSGSSSGSSGGGGDGTYPTITQTPKMAANAASTVTVTVVPTATIKRTTTQPAETVQETTKEIVTETTKKPSPGFEIVATIGIFATIYIMRRRK